MTPQVILLGMSLAGFLMGGVALLTVLIRGAADTDGLQSETLRELAAARVEADRRFLAAIETAMALQDRVHEQGRVLKECIDIDRTDAIDAVALLQADIAALTELLDEQAARTQSLDVTIDAVSQNNERLIAAVTSTAERHSEGHRDEIAELAAHCNSRIDRMMADVDALGDWQERLSKLEAGGAPQEGATAIAYGVRQWVVEEGKPMFDILNRRSDEATERLEQAGQMFAQIQQRLEQLEAAAMDLVANQQQLALAVDAYTEPETPTAPVPAASIPPAPPAGVPSMAELQALAQLQASQAAAAPSASAPAWLPSVLPSTTVWDQL
jgi:hypothetical protein